MTDQHPQTQRLQFDAGAGIPNHPDLPALLRPGAFDADLIPEDICSLLEENGWRGTWIGSVFDYHHFHPDAHEALAVARGTARLMLGGAEGREVDVSAGDLLILPVGTGHCRLDRSDDFAICGAYPPGQEQFTTLRAGADCAHETLRDVPLPETDPGTGVAAPLRDLWS